MDHLPKKLFFAVWDLPELRAIIRSFMWPGRRSATWYQYRNLVAACANGYVYVLMERSHALRGGWDEAIAIALKNGHDVVVHVAVARRLKNYYGDIATKSIGFTAAIEAAKANDLMTVKLAKLADNEKRAVRSAALNSASIRKYIDPNNRKGIIWAAIRSNDMDALRKLQPFSIDDMERLISAAATYRNVNALIEFVEGKQSVAPTSELEITMWLYEHGYVDESVKSAISRSDLDSLRWIHETQMPLGESAMLLASMMGNLEIVKWLDGKVSYLIKDVLDNAVIGNHTAVFRWVVREKGATPTRTHLLRAVQNGHDDVAMVMLDEMKIKYGDQEMQAALRNDCTRAAYKMIADHEAPLSDKTYVYALTLSPRNSDTPKIATAKATTKQRKETFALAIQRGWLDLAKSVRDSDSSVSWFFFVDLCGVGDLGVVRWVHETTGLCPSWHSYMRASYLGRQDLAEWIYSVRNLMDPPNNRTDDDVLLIVAPTYHVELPRSVRQSTVEMILGHGSNSYEILRDLCDGCTLLHPEKFTKCKNSDILIWLRNAAR